MSLSATFIKAVDGLYYEGSWSGPGWFICLDDDEPPELVINVETLHPALDTKKISVVRNWLATEAPYFYAMNENDCSGSRLFGGKFRQTRAWFGHFVGRPPVQDHMKGHGEARWHGCLQGAICPNAKINGSVWYPELRCSCGKCRKGWLK